jgi:hypothetical protein
MAARVQQVVAASCRWCGRSWIARRRTVRRLRPGCSCLSRAARANSASTAPLMPSTSATPPPRSSAVLSTDTSTRREGEQEALDKPEGQLWSRPQSRPCLGSPQRHRALQPRTCTCLGTPAIPERRKLRPAKPKEPPRLLGGSLFPRLLSQALETTSFPAMAIDQRCRLSVRRTVGSRHSYGTAPCPAEPELAAHGPEPLALTR